MRTDLVAIDSDAVADCQSALPEEELLDLMVEAFEALADPSRAKILYSLKRRHLCVRDLAITIGSSESAVSHQLRILRDRGLVKAVRKGHVFEYRLGDHHVAELFKAAEPLAAHRRHAPPDRPPTWERA